MASGTLSVNAQTLAAAKARLSELETKLRLQDDRQRKAVQGCDNDTVVKGEFETTAQFQQRQDQKEDLCWNQQREEWNQQGKERQEIYREMSRLISGEYEVSDTLDIGNYDADRQMFPIAYHGELIKSILVPLANAREFKQAFGSTPAAVKVGLHLNLENSATEYLISTKVKILGRDYTFERGDLDAAQAMFLIFGNYDRNLKRSSWKVDTWDEDGRKSQKIVYARLVKVIDYVQGGVPKRVVITKTPPEEENYACHACAMHVSLGVFSKTSNGWRLQQSRRKGFWKGAWGDVEAPSLVKIGPNRFALKFDAFDMGQGYETGITNLYAIDEGSINEILYLQSHKSNIAAISDVSRMEVKDIKVSFKPGSNPDYYDALFVITGKAPKKVGRKYVLTPYSRTEIHPFSDSKYYIGGAPW
ncbi:MAG: hypothetical protein WBC19_08470 [Pyrinomonadaceae bacterium]